MNKIESLNNAQKTVLKLEKEINAISNNLSKVKEKDHSTLKKIINNINYLLIKDAHENNLHNNEIYEQKGINGIEEIDEDQINRQLNTDINNQYNYNSVKNNDYLSLVNKQKNNNNKSRKINKQYFNRKCISSSRINTNIEDKYYINAYNYNKNINISTKENSHRNKIIGYSNKNYCKTNMTYSKPRLLTEYSKRNSNANFNIKTNTSIKNEQNKNMKYSTLNEKIIKLREKAIKTHQY